MATLPFRVKAVYDYTSGHEDDLNFNNGQIITVTDVEDNDWYFGEYIDDGGNEKQGLFPKNFVERYEPVTPPRPIRPAKKKTELEPQAQNNEPAELASTMPVPVVKADTPNAGAETSEEEDGEEEQHQEQTTSPAVAPASTTAQARNELSGTQQLPASVSSPSQAQKIETKASAPAIRNLPPPPPTARSPPSDQAEAPKSSSFKDRIAAFNKPAASPLAPPKPGQLQTSTYIKKPFVAPPPSRDAYVPIPRDPAPIPQRMFQREENTASTGSAQEDDRNFASSTLADEPQDDLPKPTSLKERIALLQKQQLEQSTRHAELAAKKAKPAAPPPRRQAERSHEDDGGVTSADLAQEQPLSETKGDESVDAMQSVHNDTKETTQSAGRDAEDAGQTATNQASRAPLSDPPPAAPQLNIPSEAESDEEDSTADTQDQRLNPESEEQEAEAEEEIDPEIRRRLEIRERMAKMSGGMGMAGMFGPPGGLPMPSPRKAKPAEIQHGSQEEDHSSSPPVQPVPVMALPGMALPPLNKVRTAEDESTSRNEANPKALPPRIPGTPKTEDDLYEEPMPLSRPLPPLPLTNTLSSGSSEVPSDDRDADPVSSLSRAAPARQNMDTSPLSSNTESGSSSMRQPPPLPPAPPRASTQILSNSDDSDDEPSAAREAESLQTTQGRRLPPPIPTDAADGTSDTAPISPVSIRHEPQVIKASTFPQSASTNKENRMSRPPPPIPSAAPALPSSPSSMRGPPPLPPSMRDQNVTASGTEEEHEDEEDVTESEEDSDADVVAGESHKDALAANQNSNVDGMLTSHEEAYHHSGLPSLGPPSGVPPVPDAYASRGAPPPPPPREPPPTSRQSSDLPRSPPPLPPPSQPSGKSRQSSEIPRSLPPPIPQRAAPQDTDYDPYNYNSSPPLPAKQLQGTSSTPRNEKQYADLQESTPIPVVRGPPPQPPTGPATSSLSAAAPDTRQSLDVPRAAPVRASLDGRPSVDQHSGFMAHEIDIARSSNWWLQRKMPPPSIQSRVDIVYEIEESTAIQQDGSELVLKHVYVLFMDYSQTVVTARYSPSDPSALDFTQRFEQPPAPLRQDQLEDAHTKFGTRIAEMANQKLNHVVGNGSSVALIAELLNSFPDAVPAVGGRSFGAVVYANMANATVQQFDEIRTGDIITFRNAKLQGHKGPMKQKYNIDIGKTDHAAAVVVDWDGTKKKIRAWEQGRESKKVKIESFKLGDLKSGEVKIWRVVGRDWVGWGSKS